MDLLKYAEAFGFEQAYAHAERYWANYARNAPYASEAIAHGRIPAQRLTPYFEARFAHWHAGSPAAKPQALYKA